MRRTSAKRDFHPIKINKSSIRRSDDQAISTNREGAAMYVWHGDRVEAASCDIFDSLAKLSTSSDGGRGSCAALDVHSSNQQARPEAIPRVAVVALRVCCGSQVLLSSAQQLALLPA